MKRLPPRYGIGITPELMNSFTNFFGEKNVKVVEKGIENLAKRY